MVQTKRDQVEAHRFVMNRLSAGMLRADANTHESPTRSTSRGLYLGTVLGVAIGVVIAIYGLVVGGGSTSWRTDGTLILVKDSGARMLYLGGELHPVRNEASARLLAGSRMKIRVLRARSLAGVAMGVAVGITGAPESLPAPRSLSTAPWSACVVNKGGATAAVVSVLAAAMPTARPLTPGEAVLASAPDQAIYLLWNGARWKLGTASGAVAALGYDSVQPIRATAAILNILPAGPDLTAPPNPGRGEAGPTFAGGLHTRVGQLFAGPSGEHYLLRRDGLIPLTATLLALLRGDPATQREAYGGQPVVAAAVGPDDLARHRSTANAADLTGNGAFPTAPPTALPVAGRQAVCLRVAPDAAVPTTRVDVAEPDAVAGRASVMEPGVTRSCSQADQVNIRAGTGAVARGLSAGAGTDSVQYLVTDVGVKYPMSADGARQLGYEGGPEVRLPAAMLALLPTGPELDPRAVVSLAPVPEGSGGARGCQP